MKRVLEIGCGAFAGPKFDGSQHIVLDTQLSTVAKHSGGTTPVVGDARNLPFATGTFDVVLARNVFGDQYLGHTISQLQLNAVAARALRGEPTPQAEIDELALAAENAVSSKYALLREAARVLLQNGQLVVVEQYTPEVAHEFIQNIAGDSLLAFRPVELHSIAPANYADYQLKMTPTQTWAATKPR